MFSITPFQATLAALSMALTCAAQPLCGQEVHYSAARRNGEKSLQQHVVATRTKALHAKLGAIRSGVSLAVADFDADGTRDLITGYSAGNGGLLLLQRGSSLALTPGPNEWEALARGEAVAPYVEAAEPIDLPVRPDFLQTADIHGFGHADVVAAAKGGSALYLLFGKGDGTFAAPFPIPLASAIRSLTTWTDATGNNLLVAGVCGASGCGLQVLDREGMTKAFIPTSEAVTSIQTGSINGGPRQDLVLVAGSKVLLLDGDSVFAETPVMETLPVAGGSAVAIGSFVADRRGFQQVAVLDLYATLHVLARQGVDNSVGTSAERAAQQNAMRMRALSGERLQPTPLVKRTGMQWSEVETLPNIGPGGEGVLFFRAHLSAGGNDDLAVIAGTQYVTVAHQVERQGTTMKTTPVVTIDSTAAPVSAAVATRVNADARFGVVTLGQGIQPLTFGVPATYRTMIVNTTVDGAPTSASLNACVNGTSGCSLRAAVTQANKDRSSTGTSKVDTINIPAGTYTLSANNINSSGATQTTDYLGSVNIHLVVDASMNLVGAGPASTIIDANNLDQVFAVDYGSFYSTGSGDFESASQNTFFSGMTIRNGKNPNNPGGISGSATAGCTSSSGYCSSFGGNMIWVAEPSSNLVMNNVILTAGNSPYSGGGGMYVFFDTTLAGTALPLEIDNSSITNNVVSDPLTGNGGGGLLIVGDGTTAHTIPLILTSDTISGNSAYAGSGGGVIVQNNANATTITNSTISNNTADSSNVSGSNAFGGGLSINGPLTMSGTTVSGNAGKVFGGGLYVSTTSYGGSITTSTFTGNSLSDSISGRPNPSDGAGVCVESSATASQGTLTVQYSRFRGNTGGTATGLAVGCTVSGTSYAPVTATNNWWGCNPTTSSGSIAGTGCDTAHVGNASNGTLNVSPYTNLTLSLSSSSIASGSTITATASLGQNSSGTVYSAANDFAYLATPISAFTLARTGTVSYNPSATAFGTGVVASTVSNAAATATGTTNSAGSGTATVTVDGSTVTAPYTVLPQPPVANAQSVNVPFNTATAITLTATNSPTSYSIASNPSHGTLSGFNSTTGNVTYTPSANYSGADSFTFTATNTGGTSSAATVTINVAPGTPTANSQSVNVAFNTATAITLTGSDPDSPARSLTYTVATAPAHGTLSGTAPNLTYTPTSNYSGSDSFTFTVNNGVNTSSAATVSINVAPGTPTANSQSATTNFNTSKPLTLTGSDPDTPALTLTYSVATSPTHGTLSGFNSSTGSVTYTPTVNYSGADSFTFRVSNGTNTSSPATVSITVTPGTPTANSQSATTSFNTAKAITVTGSDPDTPALTLTYTVATTPAHGTLSGTAPNLTYTPVANYQGSDSFTFTVNNGTNTSSPATVSITVTPGTPTANNQSVSTGYNTAKAITMTGSDPDTPALPLTYTVLTSPAHGTLSGTAPNLTYTPTTGYSGADSFTFRVSNGTNSSSPATVSITVGGPATHFSITGTSNYAAPNVAGTYTVTALDSSNNVVPSYTGTVHFSSTDSFATLPANYTFVAGDNGVHVFNITLSTAGTQSISATDTVTAITGTDSGISVFDAVAISNANGNLVRLDNSGAQTNSANQGATSGSFGAIAIDNSGNYWYAENASNTLYETSRTFGTNSSYTGGGLNAPVGIAISQSTVWVANTNNTVSAFTTGGVAVTGTSGSPLGGTLSIPTGIIIDSSGDLWITNSGNGTVTKTFGATDPIVTPQVTATTNATQGARP